MGELRNEPRKLPHFYIAAVNPLARVLQRRRIVGDLEVVPLLDPILSIENIRVVQSHGEVPRSPLTPCG